ncbi:MAG: plasmid stabilization protein [Vulcanimicrobiota bacterium]
MASITIRNLDPSLKRLLRLRAARHNCSMEEEARRILRLVLTCNETPTADLLATIRARFEPLGGVDLDIPPRAPMRSRGVA